MDINNSSLNLIKKYIDETILQAQNNLEEYVEDPDENSMLKECYKDIHQVTGVLQMLELYGAAMLSEEMEALFTAMYEGKVRQQEDACEVLMRCILQLPNYLEHLQNGQLDMPIVLLPLLNDLRAMRREKLLSEGALFSINLEISLDKENISDEGPGSEALKVLAKKVRHPYQLGLLGWFRDKDPKHNLAKITEVLRMLEGASTLTNSHRLWWVSLALVESLLEEALESSVTVKLLLGQVDRQIKQLLDQGEKRLNENPPLELIKNILYYVARSKTDTGHIQDVKNAYNLEKLLPQLSKVDQAKDSLSGPNLEMLRTVSNIIKEDLNKIKDAMDLYARTGCTQKDYLESIRAIVSQTGDTLGVLGLGIPRNICKTQSKILALACADELQLDESVVLQIANSLLFIESTLDNMSSSGRIANDEGGHVLQRLENISNGTAQEELEVIIPQAEYNRVLSLLMKEALKVISEAKEIINKISVDKSDDENKVTFAIEIFKHLSRMFIITELENASKLSIVIEKYLYHDIGQTDNYPNEEMYDSLADAVASLEYYMEAIRDNKPHREAILNLAEISAEKLGRQEQASDEVDEIIRKMIMPTQKQAQSSDEIAAVIEMPEPIIDNNLTTANEQLSTSELDNNESGELGLALGEEMDESGTSNVVAPEDMLDENKQNKGIDFRGEMDLAGVVDENIANEDIIDGQLLSEQSQFVLPDLAVMGEDTDEEMFEIFTEEAEEELERLKYQLPLWRKNEADTEALATIRRSFHTLKGSGRLVGALMIGEFAWAYESLLNRLIDNKIQLSAVIHDALAGTLPALEQLIEQIKTKKRPTIDIQGLMDKADDFQEESALEVEHTVERRAENAEVSSQHIAALQPNLAIIGDDTDDEMMEIFLEEAEEEYESLNNQIPIWLKDNADTEAMATIRRSYHTLKGSGRLVGALLMGEFAWSYESLLNHVMDEKIVMSKQIGQVMMGSLPVLAQLIGQLKGGNAPETNIQTIIDSNLKIIAEAKEAKIVNEVLDDNDHSIDPMATYDVTMIYSIFVAEAKTHTATIKQYINRCREDIDNHICNEDIIRAFHTLKGSAQMSKVDSIGLIAGKLEMYARKFREARIKITDEMIDIFHAGVLEVDHLIEALPENKSIEQCAEIIEKINTLARVDCEPAESKEAEIFTADLDESMVKILLDEGKDILGSCTAYLHQWQKNPKENAMAGEIQEQMGALHGGAKMANLSPVSDLTQATIALLDEVKNKTIDNTTEIIKIIEKSIAKNGEILEQVRKKEPIKTPHHLIDDIHNLSIQAGDIETIFDENKADLEEIYFDETVESIALVKEILSKWFEDIDKIEPKNELLAELNTIEGAAKMAGVLEMSHLSTELQQLIAQCNDYNETFYGLMNESFEAMKIMLQQAKEKQVISAHQNILEKIAMMRRGEPIHIALEPVESSATIDNAIVEEIGIEAGEALVVTEEIGTLSNESEDIRDDVHLLSDLDIDEELVDIFLQEAETILESIDSSLGEWTNNIENMDCAEAIKRDLHTLKGGSRMAEIIAVADISHAMESRIMAHEKEGFIPEELMPILQKAVDEIADMFDKIRRGYLPEENKALVAELEAHDLSEEDNTGGIETHEDDIDYELVEIFLEESLEISESIDTCISKMGVGEDNEEPLEIIKRDLHTLKGGSRMAGIMSMGDLCHTMEEYIENNAISEEVLSNIQTASDHLAMMLDEIKVQEIPEAANEIIELLK